MERAEDRGAKNISTTGDVRHRTHAGRFYRRWDMESHQRGHSQAYVQFLAVTIGNSVAYQPNISCLRNVR